MEMLNNNEGKLGGTCTCTCSSTDTCTCSLDKDTLSPLLTSFCVKLVLYKINSLNISQNDKYALVQKLVTINSSTV